MGNTRKKIDLVSHRKALLQKIGSFLADRRKSRGGWAEITDRDVEILQEIIQELIEAKCEPDPDGGLPIDFILVNRFTHERIRYEPIPNIKQPESLRDLEPAFEVAMHNLSMAHNDADLLQRMRTRFIRQQADTLYKS